MACCLLPCWIMARRKYDPLYDSPHHPDLEGDDSRPPPPPNTFLLRVLRSRIVPLVLSVLPLLATALTLALFAAHHGGFRGLYDRALYVLGRGPLPSNPAAALPPPPNETAYHADATRFEAFLAERLGGCECERVRMFRASGDGSAAAAGLGEQIHDLTHTSLAALRASECLSVAGRGPFVDDRHLVCEDGGWECLFERWDGCAVRRTETVRFSASDLYSDCERLDREDMQSWATDAGLQGTYGVEFYTTSMTRVLTRPNDELRRRISDLKNLSGLPDDVPYIGVHVQKRRRYESVHRSVSSIADLLRREVVLRGVRHVFLGLDELHSLSTLASRVPEAFFYTIDQTSFTSGPGGTEVSVVEGLRNDRDRGLVAMAEAFIFAGADSFVGSFTTEMDRVVYELMSGRFSRPPFVDIAGSLWFPCSAGADLLYDPKRVR